MTRKAFQIYSGADSPLTPWFEFLRVRDRVYPELRSIPICTRTNPGLIRINTND